MQQKASKANKANLNSRILIGVCLAVLLCLIVSVWLLSSYTNSADDEHADTAVRTAPQSQNDDGQNRERKNKVNEKTIAYAQLPTQAQDVYVLILKGGPFKYPQDGSTFSNREKRLPQKAHGYYKEYTVSTPQVKHRGAKRIVCGGKIKTTPQVCYYTVDHYKSFRELVGTP